MILQTQSGATIVLDECHWTEGAYLSLTHAGGAGTVLDVATIDRVQAELERIKTAIADRNAKQQRKVG